MKKYQIKEKGMMKVVCTCGKDMRRTGGSFGGNITQDTYCCDDCSKRIIVITPKVKEQEEFAKRVRVTLNLAVLDLNKDRG